MPRWPLKDKPKMVLITVSITQHYRDLLDSFVYSGVVPSRSSAVRMVLSHGIPILQQMVLDQEMIIEYNKVSDVNNNIIPTNCIFVETKNGKYQKYRIVEEA